jgi:hypothetical protein
MAGDRCFETTRILVQIIDFVDRDTLFLLSIEKADVLLCAIEMQATDRLAVVVIKKNPAIAVDIADGDALRRHDFAQNGPDDVVPLPFICSGASASTRVFRQGSTHPSRAGQRRGFHRWRFCARRV